MAKELKTPFASGNTVYAVVINAAGQTWRVDSHVFETPLAADWANYGITVTEQSTTGIYEGDFPTTITTAGAYYVLFRQQAGGSPAISDNPGGMLGGTIFWSGSAEISAVSTSQPADSPTVAKLATMIQPQASPNQALSQFTAAALANGPSQGGSGSGTGPIAINQNTGGVDNLRYVDGTGEGIGGASILIYLATDWPSQPTRVQAMATTGADGRWVSPAFVQSGTYVAVFTKIGADGPDVSPPFSV